MRKIHNMFISAVKIIKLMTKQAARMGQQII